MEKLSSTKCKTNEEVSERIRKRKRKWIDHTLRGDSRMVTEGKLEGRWTRERPTHMMLDWMMTGDI